MLPVLLLPVAVPVLIAAVRSTQAALSSGAQEGSGWLSLLLVFDVVFLVVCCLVFEYVLEE
jgi:heme exporter protein B